MDKPMAAFFVARLARVQAAPSKIHQSQQSQTALQSPPKSRRHRIRRPTTRLLSSTLKSPFFRRYEYTRQNRVQKSSANGFNSGLPSTIQPAYLYCAYLSISTNPARSGFRAMYSKVAWNAASVRALSLRTLS